MMPFPLLLSFSSVGSLAAADPEGVFFGGGPSPASAPVPRLRFLFDWG